MSTDTTRVEVYWNLHKKCFSYRPARKGGRVLHASSLLLENVTFAVQPAGRERVLREKRKNVHAFVRGDLLALTDLNNNHYWSNTIGFEEVSGLIDDVLENGWAARYNPYEAGHFQISSIGPSYALAAAEFAFLQDKSIIVQGVKLNNG
jgi:hypothetical protein